MLFTIADIEAFLPPRAKAWSPLLNAFVWALNVVLLVFRASYLSNLPISGASGVWLTLRAKDYGIARAPGEDDATLRARIRNVADAVTLPALRAAIDAVLAPHTNVLADIHEYWAEPLVLDTNDLTYAAVADNSNVLSGTNAIMVIIPDFGNTSPIYDAVRNELDRLRGAGISVTLVAEGAP